MKKKALILIPSMVLACCVSYSLFGQGPPSLIEIQAENIKEKTSNITGFLEMINRFLANDDFEELKKYLQYQVLDNDFIKRNVDDINKFVNEIKKRLNSISKPIDKLKQKLNELQNTKSELNRKINEVCKIMSEEI